MRRQRHRHAQGGRGRLPRRCSCSSSIGWVGVGRDWRAVRAAPTGASSTAGAGPGPTRWRHRAQVSAHRHRPQHLRRRDAVLPALRSGDALRAGPQRLPAACGRRRPAADGAGRAARSCCFVRDVRRRLREETSVSTYWIRGGAVIGLLAIALQETVEFSLQMPGNAVLFAVLCGIALHRSPARRAGFAGRDPGSGIRDRGIRDREARMPGCAIRDRARKRMSRELILMHLLHVVGARPNFMKAAPVLRGAESARRAADARPHGPALRRAAVGRRSSSTWICPIPTSTWAWARARTPSRRRRSSSGSSAVSRAQARHGAGLRRRQLHPRGHAGGGEGRHSGRARRSGPPLRRSLDAGRDQPSRHRQARLPPVHAVVRRATRT